MFSSILIVPFSFFFFLLVFSELKPKSLIISSGVTYGILLLTSAYLFLSSCFFNFSGKFVYSYRVYLWSTLGNSDVGLNIWLDYVSIIMSLTVLFIATMVNIFSVYYMANDPFIVRFFAYLSLFTFCMLLLVVSSDLLQFFIGWELVGLCSFLLINFWYTRKEANSSAAKAILVNRVGDFFFILAMGLILRELGTLCIYDISWLAISNTFDFGSSTFNRVCLFFFIAVMSKSAQIGLHSWLPDAMEGPTPVSALIHAATMVTAGIYLLLRLSTLFLVCSDILNLIAIVGSTTAIFGATTGSAQNDIKKIIAFSTCSQLGYMVSACGLGHFDLAFFHLVTHAFFKSLLFLSAGVIIHTLSGEQDIRKMGYLRNVLPITYTAITVASLALSGIPFLSGYFSKEMIISSAFLDDTVVGFFSGILLIIAAVFTSGYSAKLIYFVFFLKNKDTTKALKSYHREDSESIKYFQILPLFTLTVMSIFVGFLFKDAIIGVGSNSTLSFFDDFTTTKSKVLWAEYLPLWLKLVLNFCSLSGFIFYFIIVHNNLFGLNVFIEKKKGFFYSLYSFFYNRWNIDSTISSFLNYFYLFIYEDFTIFFIQKKIFDFFTVRVVSNLSESMSAVYSAASILSPYEYARKTVIWSAVWAVLSEVSTTLVTFYY